jgi:hypothetical protein
MAMKWFWGIVLVAVVVAGVVVARRGLGGEGGQAGGDTKGEKWVERAPEPLLAGGEAAAPIRKDEVVVAPEVVAPVVKPPKVHDEPKAPESVPVVAPIPAPEAVKAVEPAAAPEAKKGVPKAGAPTGDSSLNNALDEALGLKAKEVGEGKKSGEEGKGGEGKGEDRGWKAPATAKLVQQADGSVLVDDKYVVKGTGTEADPFVISWELLVSAQDTYQPRLGQKVIPDRLKMLSGKWVKISGFTAFPLGAQSNDEMLVMLNQWDGCCIGVPPTPYDAIEVKLKKPVVGEDRLRVSGGVKGILKVDPYLIKDWLVSLYLMDDGELVKEGKTELRQAGAHMGGVGGGVEEAK